jgi:3-methyladenine DNA glycosylase Tag
MINHERLKQPVSLAGYLETMSKAVFQTGISWQVVENKWPGIRAAMSGFDPQVVSRYTGADIDRLLGDARVIRNRRKLEGIVLNARKMLELDSTSKGFRAYLRLQGGFEETAAALHRDFKFMGETGSYYFLWVVGEKVPPWEEWQATRDR